MTYVGDTPTLGLLIGLPATIICVVVCILVIVYGVVFEKFDPAFPIGAGILGLVVTFGIAAYGFWPWSHQYHYYKPVEGSVQATNSRIIASSNGNGSDQKFVLKVNGTDYGVSDTRAAGLHKGDDVKLNCKRAFEWGSQDGWDCKWKGAVAR